MDNKNKFFIAVIGQSRNKSTLSEYLNIYTAPPIDNSIDFCDIELKNTFIEELNSQIEFINKIYKLSQLENKKHNLLNQKRKQYSYILNYTLKNK